MKAGQQAGTRTGPAMSLIVILGFAEVEQMSVALDAAMTVTRQARQQQQLILNSSSLAPSPLNPSPLIPSSSTVPCSWVSGVWIGIAQNMVV
ncbi:TPA: hypothetical protein ACH3X3_010215 [Trebouxia sp. C0006]